VVRENEGGKIGTFEEPLDVPAVSDKGLSLSSVVLSNEVKPSSELARAKMQRDKDAPLQVANRSVLPSVTRVFRTNQTLSVYLESYASKTPPPAAGQSVAPGPATPPAVALVFFRNGKKTAEAGPYAGKPEKSSDLKTSYFVQIPLERFPTGRYTMQVNILDPAFARVAFARVPLAIVKPPPRVPRAGAGS